MFVRFALFLSVLVLFAGCAAVRPEDRLAGEVARAAGASHWEEVSSLSFTITRREDQAVKSQRTYWWERARNLLTVSEKEKTRTIDLAHPDPSDLPAIADWQRDSFWVVVPFQLFDPGVTRTRRGLREVDGRRYETLEVSLPSQACTFLVDAETDRIAFIENSLPELKVMTTWESPQSIEGLSVATVHRCAADQGLAEARGAAIKAKAAYDQSVAAVSQGQDPPGVEQLMSIIVPTLIQPDAVTREGERLKELELRVGKDNLQFKQRVEQWRYVIKREQDEARAKAKIQVLDQYKQMAESEMGRVEAIERRLRSSIEVSNVQIIRSK